MKKSKFLLIILVFTLTLSCKSDDEINYSEKLVGEWLRSDFSDELEFKLNFNANNVGFRTFKTGTDKTGIISSLVPFNWSADENSLTIDGLDVVIITEYTINSEGELLLHDYSDLPFIKIE